MKTFPYTEVGLRQALAFRDDIKANYRHKRVLTVSETALARVGARHLADVAEGEQKNWRLWIADLTKYFGADFEILNLTTDDIKGYKAHLDTKPRAAYDRRPGPLSVTTKNRYLKALRKLVDLVAAKAYGRGVVFEKPTIKLFKGGPAKRKLKITLADVATITEALPDPLSHEPFGRRTQYARPHRAMWLTLLVTGQRWGDCARMTRDQIHNHIITYQSSKTHADDILVRAPEILQKALADLQQAQAGLPQLQNNPLLFPNPETGEPYTSLKKAIRTICQIHNIPPFETAYQLRHLAASIYLDKTKNVPAVQKFMGHHSPKMLNEVYGHLQGQIDQASEALGQDLEAMTAAIGTPAACKARKCDKFPGGSVQTKKPIKCWAVITYGLPRMVPPARLERATLGLQDRCSTN